jgi:3-oxoadipate enol-lactonase
MVQAGPMAVALHHELSGPTDAPAVLVLGGLCTNLHVWDRQMPGLTGRFRVLRADLRGHGGSPAPPGPYALADLADDLVALLDATGIERAHVVGHSFGGMVAMCLAVREPARVDRLALVCTAAKLWTPEVWQERADDVRARGSGAITEGLVEAWLTPAGRADRALVAGLEAMVAATPAEGLAGCCEAIGAMDLRPDLPRIAAPTLALAGADDAGTPPECLAEIASSVRDGRLLVVPGAAHLPMVEQPAAVTGALLAHLGAAG